MIIFGTGTSHLGAKRVSGTCSHCGTNHQMILHIYQRYFDVFWIPVFPVGKTGVCECQHCKYTLRKGEMPETLRQEYQEAKAQFRTPFWSFAGLVIVAGLMIFAGIMGAQDSKQEAAFIQNPQKGDVYEVKLSPNQYTLFKVVDVHGNTASLQRHAYETDKVTAMGKLKEMGDTAYFQGVEKLTKVELLEMYERGKIIDIDRLVKGD
ncbi:zinc-ribbon domain-containing protein [Echinicola soli]|uniref:Zinc-ribbon domain-containing protein n=1 Tax=Echinicola soli TaxID=2591634 RepID=A0A514CIK8_9BACT|nr:zinc-ribbon domain-containing protein [Echinicola soli]QDH79616.1 zinc-ribbon domain-containing protein [Echinicola soli]